MILLPQDRFPSTRTSLLLAVHQPELRVEAIGAIADLYWKPAYKYIRLKWRRGEDDAMDDTQDFFAHLLDRDLLARWDPARASFRTYLRLSIDGHVKNRLTADARLKRGGGAHHFEQMDFSSAERELALTDPAADPEETFHREWQRQVFASAIADLRREHGATVRFQVFEQYDLAPDPEQRPSYDELAHRYNIPVTSVTNHLAWARRELRKLVLDVLTRTTAGDNELRREARAVFDPSGAPR